MTDDKTLMVQIMNGSKSLASQRTVQIKHWEPKVGQETKNFLAKVVPEASQDKIQESAISILGRGISPSDQEGHQTGLVVGYVQSGKTMSFETVCALAHDNDFQMIIIITGTSNPLLRQSTERIKKI